MNSWAILGIEATDNISIIKKAYAQELKKNHPEDNPTGFQNLKEAYDFAITYAKFMQKRAQSSITNLDERDSLEYSIRDNTELYENNFSAIELTTNQNNYNPEDIFDSNEILDFPEMAPPLNWNTENTIFMEQLDHIYSDYFERINLENWTSLLNHDALWNIENRPNLELRILRYLSSHYYLPQEVWILLDTTFNLIERKEELEAEYGIPFVNHYMKILKRSFQLNYLFIPREKEFDYDKYLELKEIINDRILIKDSRDAEIYLNKAKKLSQTDPDLIRMEAIINFVIRKYEHALILLNQALSLNKNDLESLYYRASINIIKRNYAEALKDLNKILMVQPNEANSVLLALECNLKLNNLTKSFELLKLSFSLSQKLESYSKLDKLKKRLRLKLWLNIFIKPFSFPKNVRCLLWLYNIDKNTFTIKKTLKYLIKISKWIFIILLFLAIAVATKIGVVFFLLYFVRQYEKKK